MHQVAFADNADERALLVDNRNGADLALQKQLGDVPN
jgi:hypothetical protein